MFIVLLYMYAHAYIKRWNLTMTNVTDKLTFSRGLTLKNRIIMAPMTTQQSFYDGSVTSDELAHYNLRSGEVGAVITAASFIREDGKGWEGEIGAHTDDMIPGLTKLAATIKQNGTRAILQIFHAGRMTDSNILRGNQPISASAVPAERPNAEVPKEMNNQEILSVIESFKTATIRAIKAGFDGVEIHGANTFLIQQFFSPHSNRRNDEWGGNRDKRFHFIDKLIDEVISTVDNSPKKEFIIGYRFSPEEFENPGISFEDTLYLVDRLSDKKIDYIHISNSDYNRISKSPDYQEKSMLHYIYETVNQRVPFIGMGDVRTSQDVTNVLKAADLVAVGRSIMIDPHWSQKIIDGQEDQIYTTVSEYNRDELIISTGAWGFLQMMMPDRIRE